MKKCKYLAWGDRCQYALAVPSPDSAKCVGYFDCNVYEAEETLRVTAE